MYCTSTVMPSLHRAAAWRYTVHYTNLSEYCMSMLNDNPGNIVLLFCISFTEVLRERRHSDNREISDSTKGIVV